VLGATLPHGFGVNLFGTLQSGKAYTPTDVNGNATGRVYSRNGPAEVEVNLRINQSFPVSSRNRMNGYLVIENLLNSKIVKRLDPSTGEAPRAGAGQYQNPTQYQVNSVLTNPGVYGPPFSIRLGLDYDF
jgi:hypothetical protein